VTPSVTVTAFNRLVNGQSVQLWSELAGKTSYHQVATAVTNATGIAKAPAQHPQVGTSYQWRAADGGDIAAVTAPLRRVFVASDVTMTVHKKDSTNQAGASAHRRFTVR
jgi:hypothetical protein